MSDHSHYEELAALEAGGFLSDAELVEFREHTQACVDCRRVEAEFNELVHAGLPLTASPFRESLDKMKTRPDDGMRSRFLRRARLEGIVFSPGVELTARRPGWRLGFSFAAATVFATAIVAVALYGIYRHPASPQSLQAQQQVDVLKRENAALNARLSQLNQSVAAGQGEIQELRAQLGNAAATADDLRRSSEQTRGEAERSSSRNAQLLDQSRNQEKLLAEAKGEAARVSQLRLNDDASMAEQESRIRELSDKLRIASATLDMERQLTVAGKDVRELMMARQLHVVDVRDTDPDGKPSKAFGRVFLTEGKSLTFYAFDLNDDERTPNAKRTFQVWAVPETGKNSARSLGALHVDAKGQGRWVLKVDSPELLKGVNSIFVTVESTAAGTHPSDQKMLYAYLGEANRP
jgi:hypothetical protein